MKRMDHLGVLASAMSDDVRTALARARAAGFGGVLFDVHVGNLNLPELGESGLRELSHVLASGNQAAIGMRMSLGPRGLGPGSDLDRVLRDIGQAMSVCASMRSPLLCVDAGWLPGVAEPTAEKPRITPEQAGLIIVPALAAAPHAAEAPAWPKIDPASVAQVDGALADLGNRADRYGIAIAWSSGLSNFAAIERALRQASCPWYGLDLDPVSILRDAWSIDELFARLGASIRHVRARDAIRGNGQRTQPAPIGQGSTDWPMLLGNLDDAGYEGWLTVDPTELMNRPAAAAQAAEYLRAL